MANTTPKPEPLSPLAKALANSIIVAAALGVVALIALVLVVACIGVWFLAGYAQAERNKLLSLSSPPIVEVADMNWPELWSAIAQVESGGDTNAVNESEQAVGIVQIRPIMVEDVNRILRLESRQGEFTLEDRTDPAKSREMFTIYSMYWCGQRADWTAEGVARRWNGGPSGHTKDSTVSYWAKVRSVLQG